MGVSEEKFTMTTINLRVLAVSRLLFPCFCKANLEIINQTLTSQVTGTQSCWINKDLNLKETIDWRRF